MTPSIPFISVRVQERCRCGEPLVLCRELDERRCLTCIEADTTQNLVITEDARKIQARLGQ